MKYLRRKADDYLDAWHSNASRTPLVVSGARQIGKTETIRNFAKRHYESFIEINLVEEPKYKHIADDGYAAQDIVRAISRIDSSKRFPNGKKALIFFDEIQSFPDIATSLKFFAQDGRFDVICSGSLLGVNYRKISSVSVGFKTDYRMNSLDFEEFLWARGYGDDIVDELLVALKERSPLKSSVLFALKGLFLDYCTLGGMPLVVRNYIEKKSFEGSLEAQRQIVRDYRDDVRKYAEGVDQTRILNVFNHVSVQLAKEQRKFQISKVAHGARFRDYRGCIDWLVDAGVVNRCRCLSKLELPLAGNYDNDKYKLYMADTGLLIGMLDKEACDNVRANRNLGIFKGGLYENIVAEALVKCGFDLYYWRRGESPLEMDFFIRDGENIVPVEVKGGSDKSQSLRELINSDKYPAVKWGIKMSNSNIGFANNIFTMPWFCAFLLGRLFNPEEPLAMGWFEPNL